MKITFKTNNMAIINTNTVVLKNEPLTQSDGKVYSNIPNGENDFYYRRYPQNGDNKIYLSTKYLPYSVIDVNNDIEELYSSIEDIPSNDNSGNGMVYLKNEGVDKCKITNSGMRFEVGSDSYSIRNTNGGGSGIYLGQPANMFFSMWIAIDDLSSFVYVASMNLNKVGDGSFYVNGLIGVNFSNSGKFFFNTGSGFINGLEDLVEGEYYHVGCLLDPNEDLHFFVNGVYQGFVAITKGYDDDLNLGVQLAFTNIATGLTFDDIYYRVNMPITLSGYAIGDPVYEKPERGGFDSIIKQY